MKYLELKDTVDVLVEVARSAGMESDSNHPEDIASAMVVAIEGATTTLVTLMNRDMLKG